MRMAPARPFVHSPSCVNASPYAARSLLPPLRTAWLGLLIRRACLYERLSESPLVLPPCPAPLLQTIKLGVQYSLWGGEWRFCVQCRPGCPLMNQLPYGPCMSTCATEEPL